jgi:hypothetical protein
MPADQEDFDPEREVAEFVDFQEDLEETLRIEEEMWAELYRDQLASCYDNWPTFYDDAPSRPNPSAEWWERYASHYDRDKASDS